GYPPAGPGDGRGLPLPSGSGCLLALLRGGRLLRGVGFLGAAGLFRPTGFRSALRRARLRSARGGALRCSALGGAALRGTARGAGLLRVRALRRAGGLLRTGGLLRSGSLLVAVGRGAASLGHAALEGI